MNSGGVSSTVEQRIPNPLIPVRIRGALLVEYYACKYAFEIVIALTALGLIWPVVSR